MSTSGGSAGVGSAGGGGAPLLPVPSREEATIQGDKILFAGKKFRLKMGSKVETSPALLLMVKNFLNEGGKLQKVAQVIAQNAAGKAVAVSAPAARFSCPINLETGAITVIRHAGKVATRVGFIKGSDVQATVKSSQLKEMGEQIANKTKFSNTLKKGLAEYSQATIREAISQIKNEGHIRLGSLVDPEYSFVDEWREKTLGDKLHMQGNEGLYAALDEVSRATGKGGEMTNVEKCRKGIVLFILQNMQKNPLVISTPKGEYVQRVYKANIKDINALLKSDKSLTPADLEKSFEVNRAHPSESDRAAARRKYPGLVADQTAHCSNLRVVDICGKDGKVVKKIFGSGRADNPERLKSLVLFTMSQQLQVKGRPCFHENSEGQLEFRHVISSYKDFSRLKKFLVEDERSLIENLIEAAAEWPAAGYKLKVEIDGNEREVVLKKPIIANQPFSQYVIYKAKGQEHSDRCNFVANQQLFAEFIKDKAPRELQAKARVLDLKLMQALKSDTSFMNEKTGLIDFDRVPFDKLLKTVKGYTIGDGDFFGSKEFKAYQQEMSKQLLIMMWQGESELIRRQATCLYAIAFRKKPPVSLMVELERQVKNPESFSWRPTEAETLHAMDLEIYRHNICSDLGLSKGKQCKSGSDRTGGGVAIEEAVERFKVENNGKVFMPKDKLTKEEYEDLMKFKTYFREAIVQHGAAYAVETKGYSGLKMAWGKGIAENPVPLKYLYLAEDMDYLRSEQRLPVAQPPDVVGLTYEQLQAGGSEQYKGTLTSRALLYGKSETAGVTKKGIVHSYPMDHVRTVQAGIDSADIKALNDKIRFILSQLKIAVPSGEDVVSSKLELKIYAGKLGLEAHFKKNKEGVLEWEELKNLLSTMEAGTAVEGLTPLQNQYLKYSLQSLYNIGQERAYSHAYNQVQSLEAWPKAQAVARAAMPTKLPLSAADVGSSLLSMEEVPDEVGSVPRPRAASAAAAPALKRPLKRTKAPPSAATLKVAAHLPQGAQPSARDRKLLRTIEAGEGGSLLNTLGEPDECLRFFQVLEMHLIETSTQVGNKQNTMALLGFCRAWAEAHLGTLEFDRVAPVLRKITMEHPGSVAVLGNSEHKVFGLNYFLLNVAKDPTEFLETIWDRPALQELEAQITQKNSSGVLSNEQAGALMRSVLERYSAHGIK